MQHFATASSLELLRFDYLITGDRHRAEDLLQDALLALNRRFGDGPMRVPNPVAYARRTMTNLNITRSRRSASSEVVVDLFDDLPAPSGSDPADRDLLWQASRRLPVRQRTVRSPASRALAALPGGSRTGLLGRRCAMTDPLELIDRSNVHNKRVVPISTYPDRMALFDNHVYWMDANKGKATSAVQDYDIATGKSRVLTT